MKISAFANCAVLKAIAGVEFAMSHAIVKITNKGK
jgi:hypothetical protein